MLKKINRGLQRKDFGDILVNGLTIQTPLFGARYRKSSQTKYGWIISKKISKLAVERNKIKRRLAEVVYKKIICNVDLIVLVKKNILDSSIEEISKCWDVVYEQIGTKTTSNL